MLDNNMSQWSPGWNLTSSDPNSGLFLCDNGCRCATTTRTHVQPALTALARTHAPLHAQINFASLVIAFFATSAVFHFWALVVGRLRAIVSKRTRTETRTRARTHGC